MKRVNWGRRAAEPKTRCNIFRPSMSKGWRIVPLLAWGETGNGSAVLDDSQIPNFQFVLWALVK